MPPVFREDPYAGHNFQIVINGISDDGKAVKGSFSEVSGLDVTIDPIEYRNGSEDIRARKIPGLKKFSNIVLKRGQIGDPALFKWIKQAMDGAVQRTEGAIVLHDEDKNEVMRWTFQRGWPAKYSGPTLNAKNNEIALETLEIAHEGLTLDL